MRLDTHRLHINIHPTCLQISVTILSSRSAIARRRTCFELGMVDFLRVVAQRNRCGLVFMYTNLVGPREKYIFVSLIIPLANLLDGVPIASML